MCVVRLFTVIISRGSGFVNRCMKVRFPPVGDAAPGVPPTRATSRFAVGALHEAPGRTMSVTHFARAKMRPASLLCHCEERSDVAIRIPRGKGRFPRR